jgi:1-acyl-sn-glycerol-3-phosphate acyltransferase
MKPLYWTGWKFFRVFTKTWFRGKVFHPERIPSTGRVILASNHASYLDPAVIGAAADREIYYLTRSSAFRLPIFGNILRRVNAVPVARDRGGAEGIRVILEYLEQEKAVVLFPEGTRTHTGGLLPARSGIGLIAVKSRAPIVPVRLFGMYEAYGRHMRFPRPKPVAITFGQPLRFEALCQEAETSSKARLKIIYQEIADQVMQAIAQLKPARCD